MQPHKKFAIDVGITFIASAVTLPLGFVITVVLGRYLGAGDLGLYRMASAIYGIAMLHMRNIPPEVLKTFERIKKRRLAGVICLVSDMDKDGIDMFDMYKGREDVELAFDTMKNRFLGNISCYVDILQDLEEFERKRTHKQDFCRGSAI